MQIDTKMLSVNVIFKERLHFPVGIQQYFSFNSLTTKSYSVIA